MLSFRAMGVYMHLLSSDEPISAVALAEKGAEGEKAMRAALKELRDAGLIETKTLHVNGRLMKVTTVVQSADYRAAETGVLSQLNELYSYYSQINLLASSTNSYISFANTKTELLEEEKHEEIGGKMGYDFFGSTSSPDDDLLAERRKHEADKQAELLEAKAKHHEEKVELRDRKRANPADWTSSDVAREFANMLHDRWDIPPWQVGNTPFSKALYTARVRFGTDGAVELRMLRNFFAQPNVKDMKDPDMMWKYFITSFSALAQRAKLEMPNAEKTARVEELAARLNASLFEDYGDDA